MITINAGDNSTRLLSGGGRREIRDQPKNKKKKCRNVQGGSIYDLFLINDYDDHMTLSSHHNTKCLIRSAVLKKLDDDIDVNGGEDVDGDGRRRL